MACPICLMDPAEDDEENAWITTSCGHRMHTKCALNNAWAGNIGCPVCRTIPGGRERYDIEDAVENSRYEHNCKEMARYFQKGLRNFRTQKQPSPELRKAVNAYEKYKNKLKDDKAILVKQNEALRVIQTKMKAAFEKTKDILKNTYGKKIVSSIRFKATAFTLPAKRISTYREKCLKRKIARAAGWVEHF